MAIKHNILEREKKKSFTSGVTKLWSAVHMWSIKIFYHACSWCEQAPLLHLLTADVHRFCYSPNSTHDPLPGAVTTAWGQVSPMAAINPAFTGGLPLSWPAPLPWSHSRDISDVSKDFDGVTDLHGDSDEDTNVPMVRRKFSWRHWCGRGALIGILM